MSELVSRWSKKHLSQILNLLSGILLGILLINEFTKINIRCDWINFISLESNSIESNFWTWLFSILLLNNVVFDIIRFTMRKKYGLCNEEKYYSGLVKVSTIEDITELFESIYAVLFMLLQINSENFYICPLYLITFIFVGVRFIDAIWHHFYFKNLAIVDKARTKK